MKNIFLALVYFWVSICLAADPPVSIKGQLGTKQIPKWNLQVPFYQATNLGGIDSLIETGNYNMLQDPGMESTATSGWAADSGGTISKTTTAADVAFGSRAMSLVTTSSGSLRSVAIAVPPGLYGQNGFAQCRVKITSANTGTFLYVSTSTTSLANMLAYSPTLSTADTYTAIGVNFVFPSSGSIYLWVDGSSGQTMKIDDCVVGPATNLAAVAQAKVAVSLSSTASLSMVHTTDTKLTFGATLTTNKLDGFSLSSGTLTATVAGEGYVTCSWEETYTSDASTIRHIRAAVRKNGTEARAGGFIGGLAMNAIEAKNPTASSSSYVSWAVGDTIECYGYQSNASGTSYNTAKQFVEVLSFPTTAQQAIKMDCSITGTCLNAFSAKVSSGGTVSDENVDWISGNCSNGATGSYTCTFNTSFFSTSPNCFAMNAASGQYSVGSTAISSSAITLNFVNMAGPAGVNTAFTIVCHRQGTDVKPGANAPIFTGSVTNGGTSGATSIMRVEWARITQSGGTYTLAASSGGVASITKNAAADISINFSPSFGLEPVCTATPESGCLVTSVNPAHSVSSYRFNMYTSNFGAACETAMYVTCMGQR